MKHAGPATKTLNPGGSSYGVWSQYGFWQIRTMHIIAILFANHPLHTGMGSIATQAVGSHVGVGWNRDLPIHWDKEYALLLKPNGSMLEVDVPSVRSHRILDEVLRTATT